MKTTMKRLALGLLLAGTTAVQAAPDHKVAFQVSTGDEEVQALALNNAANLQKQLGMDNVAVEIVAYGPGLSLLTAGSPLADRVKSMAVQEVTFSACNNTIQAITKKTGKEPVLTEGVKVVPAGVSRLVELQEQGYAYIRP